MPMDRDELDRRLAEAARVRAVLRRATREWRALGRELLAKREHGSQRPDDGDPGGR